MRLIGHLNNETSARTFGDYLFVQGIESRIEFEKEHGWAVWIPDEDKIQHAAGLLKSFLANPADPKYVSQGRSAAGLREEQQKAETAYRKKMHDRTEVFRPLAAYGFGPLTFALIVACVAVFIVTKGGTDEGSMMGLLMTKYLSAGLPEIKHGQVWRLITPIFIHFNILHILFNMLWLRDLGSMIESRQGVLRLALLVLVIGVCSNLGQFYVSGPIFGGMSGVVYGLLGYVWLRGKFDPASGLYVHPYTVLMMIIWFVLGYTTLLGNIANTAHAAGLLVGAAWGWLSSLRYR